MSNNSDKGLFILYYGSSQNYNARIQNCPKFLRRGRNAHFQKEIVFLL